MSSLEKFAKMAQVVPLFNHLDAEDVAKIFAKGLTMQVPKGDVIFYKDTTGNQMYVVLGGTVALFDGPKHLTNLHVGDMFGEMALINREPRSATAVAAEDTKVFVLTETLFEKLMTKRVAIRMLFNIIGTLSHRLRDMNHRITKLQEQLGQGHSGE